ncbi:MAG: DUF1838 family protein [Rhodospirillaceae bacterium]|nr:DUF1838 family protein [Rhodospirillaceae bacterium]
MALSRRALASTISAAALLGVSRAQAALDPAKQADVITMYRKLRYRMDDGLVFWWMVDTKIGQVETKLTPLFDMQVGSIMRIKTNPDGSFAVTSLEDVFYTDSATGEFLRQWKNPYTGETVPVAHAPVGPTTIVYRADGTPIMPKELGGSKLEGRSVVGPAIAVGDDVWVRGDSFATVTSPDPARPPFEVNDLSIYQGSLKEVSDPKVMVAAATVQSNQVTGWRAWMKMGDRPGNFMSRGVGRKVARYADMPPKWRALVAEIDPAIAADPLAALDQPPAKFDR